jgi:predicted AAA+ superfamily ATPase
VNSVLQSLAVTPIARIRYSDLATLHGNEKLSVYMSRRQKLLLQTVECLIQQKCQTGPAVVVVEHLEDFLEDGPLQVALFPVGGNECDSVLGKLSAAGVVVIATFDDPEKLPLINDYFGHVVDVLQDDYTADKNSIFRAADMNALLDGCARLQLTGRTCQQLEAHDSQSGSHALPTINGKSALIATPSCTMESVLGISEFYKELIVKAAQFEVTPSINGILLYGPPGTGKTRLIQALSNHMAALGRQVQFFAPGVADILRAEIGASELQLSAILQAAKASQPAIVFFDEMDAIFPKEGRSAVNLISTLIGTLDEWLNTGVKVLLIGATNFKGRLHHALLQADRFELQIEVGRLSREEIKTVLSRNFSGLSELELVCRVERLRNCTAAELMQSIDTMKR